MFVFFNELIRSRVETNIKDVLHFHLVSARHKYDFQWGAYMYDWNNFFPERCTHVVYV